MVTQTPSLDAEQTQQQVEARLRPYLRQYPIYDTVVEIVEGAARLEEGWWYVPVRLNTEVAHTYQYYDVLTDIEDEIKERARPSPASPFSCLSPLAGPPDRGKPSASPPRAAPAPSPQAGQ